MSSPLRYDPSAALEILGTEPVEALHDRLDEAREEMKRDAELFSTGGDVPPEKQPLDAGFMNYPRQLLDDHAANGSGSLIGRIEDTAAMFRSELDRVVLLGIGGSYMGARALFEGLLSPYHNQMDANGRGGVPRIAFEGHNLDNRTVADLKTLLSSSTDERWGVVVISKSGGTLETAAVFRIFREALEARYGADSPEATRYIIPVTGEFGKLRTFSNNRGYPVTFPIPDGIGGRFSVLTPVGLLPAAIMGLDIKALLTGAADLTDRFLSQPLGENVVSRYVAVAHAFENAGSDIRILSTWGSRLEAVGLWYDQLLSESLGKQEQGAVPLTVVNTRDLHSRGQQHQEGKRDKLITNLYVDSASVTDPVELPSFEDDSDQLNQHAGKTLPRLLDAALEGTNRAYADDRRPTADLVLPELSENTLGQVFQMFMLATVLEGRLIDINPYGQPGVEAYKKNMTEILSR